MSDYISREAVLEFIRGYRHSTDVAFHMEKHLNEIPAADVVPVVRGKWILKHDYSTEEIEDGEKYWECSLCGCGSDSYDTTWHTPFCPNCGADMREES